MPSLSSSLDDEDDCSSNSHDLVDDDCKPESSSSSKGDLPCRVECDKHESVADERVAPLSDDDDDDDDPTDSSSKQPRDGDDDVVVFMIDDKSLADESGGSQVKKNGVEDSASVSSKKDAPSPASTTKKKKKKKKKKNTSSPNHAASGNTHKPESARKARRAQPPSADDAVASLIQSDTTLMKERKKKKKKKKRRPSDALLSKSSTSSASTLRRTTSLGDLIDEIAEYHLTLSSVPFASNSSYKIKQLLAHGESGVVFVVENVLTNEVLAAKVMEKASQHKHIETRIRPEYAVLARLDHPNIVKCVEVIESDEDITMVMTYCNGQDLLRMMNSRKLDRMEEKYAREIFAQIVLGVKHMHSKGICHRDLKVENMLYIKPKKKSGIGLVKLGDFGCATEWKEDKWLTRDLGTLGYCSPEVLHPDGRYRGPEADVWSLGVVLYFLTTGRKPFKRPTKRDTKSATMGGEFSLHAWMTSELMALLRGMLKVEVSERYTLDDVLSHPWLSSSRVLTDGLESVVGNLLKYSGEKKKAGKSFGILRRSASKKFGKHKKGSSS